jgi:hypothetical protein
MTRAEHLAWAKQRALEYIDAGEMSNGVASMLSDLRKHPELENHLGAKLGGMLMMGGMLKTREQCRKWVEGFN